MIFRLIHSTYELSLIHIYKILVLETKLYNELVIAWAEFIPAIQINANQIARLDCLLAFANVARENNYIRPVVEDLSLIHI